MSFFHEAASALGIDWATLALGYHYINYNGEALYIEGVKKVIKINDTQIVLQAGKDLFTVLGLGLNVFDISGECMMIKGKIVSCAVGNPLIGE